jgi:hypothetical protein
MFPCKKNQSINKCLPLTIPGVKSLENQIYINVSKKIKKPHKSLLRKGGIG